MPSLKASGKRLRLRSKKQTEENSNEVHLNSKEEVKSKSADLPQDSLKESSSSSQGEDSGSEAGSIDVDMPLIRLPKIRKKEGKAATGAAATAGGDGDVRSLASARSSSITSIKSTASASPSDDVTAGYTVAKVKDLPKLHRAVWKCDMTKVKTATKGIKPSVLNSFDKERRTALHLACAKANQDIIIYLCSLHANVNLQDADGATPMHKLVESKHLDCLSTLVGFGGNTNLSDKFGQTPLHLVAKIGDVQASIILLEADAIVDAKDSNGMTALHIATLNGHKRLAASLLNDGFYVDAQDNQGRTSLMIAAAEGRIGLLKVLAENKADPEINDNNMFKAIDYAITRNFPECARLIEEHEKVMEREKQLEAQKPPPKPLIDPAVIEMCYGPSSSKKKATAVSEGSSPKASTESPAKSNELSAKVEASPAKSEQVPPKMEEVVPKMEEEELSDEEVTHSEVTPAKAIDEPWGDSDSEDEDALTSESKLNLRVALEKHASLKKLQTSSADSSPKHFKLSTDVDPEKKANSPPGCKDGESDSKTSVDCHKSAALHKIEASLVAVGDKNSTSLSEDKDDDTPRVEKIGGNLPNLKKKTTPLSLPAEDDGDDVDAPPVKKEGEEEAEGYDDDFESCDEESDIEPVDEQLSESDEEDESDKEEEEEPTYAPWQSLGASSQATTPRIFTYPTRDLQSPSKRAVSPLTKSIRSGDQLALSPSKSPSASVDVGGSAGQSQAKMSPSLSSATDGRGLKAALSSATDGRGLKAALSSATDGQGLKAALSSATDGQGLKAALSSATDGQGLKAALSSATDGQRLKVALSSATDGQGLKAALSSATDGQGLKAALSSSADEQKQKVSSPLAPCLSSASKDNLEVHASPSKPAQEEGPAILPEDSFEILSTDEETASDLDSEDYDYVAVIDLPPVLATPPSNASLKPAAAETSSATAEAKPSETPVKVRSFPRQLVATPPSATITLASDVSLTQVSPLAPGQAAAAVVKTEREKEEDISDLFKTDDEDEIEKLLTEAEELSTKQPKSPAKKEMVAELITSPLKKAVDEKAVSPSKKAFDEKAVSPSKKAIDEKVGTASAAATVAGSQVEGKPKEKNVDEAEADYDDEEWDSDDESDDDDDDEECGTALAWLSNSALADPFHISPPASPKSSRPSSPKKKETVVVDDVVKEKEKKNDVEVKSSQSDIADSGKLGSPGSPSSPKLRPLNANMSLQNLPPLTLSPSRSGQRTLPPLRGSPTHKQGLSPKKSFMEELLSQQELSPNGTSETESEWEKEVKAMKAHTKVTPPAAHDIVKEFEPNLTEKGPVQSLPKGEEESKKSDVVSPSQQQVMAAAAEDESDDEIVEEMIELEDSDKEDGTSINNDSLPFSPQKSLSSTPKDRKGKPAKLNGKSVTFTSPVHSAELSTFCFSDEEDKAVEEKPSLSLLDSKLGNPPAPKVSQETEANKEMGQAIAPKVTFKNFKESEKEMTEHKKREEELKEDEAGSMMPAAAHPLTESKSLTICKGQGSKEKDRDSAVKKSASLMKEAESQLVEATPKKIENSSPVRSDSDTHPLSNVLIGNLQSKKEDDKKTPVISGPNLPLGARPISSHPARGRGISRNASVSDSHLEVSQLVGGVDRRGLGRGKAAADDTDDDFTLTSFSTESDVSPVRTPRSLMKYTPHTSTVLTTSQLHTSPVPVNAVTLSPANLQKHNANNQYGGLFGGGVGETAKQTLLAPQGSVSEMNSSCVDAQESQELLSEASKHSGELPFSPLLRLNQSLGGGTSLLNSAHTAQLQESLRETKRGLEQTLNAQQASERSRKHLAAKLEDYQRRHDEVVGVKLSLENNKLDLELEVRELRYQLDQAKEGLKASENINSQLRSQIDKMEARLSKEIEARQSAEFRRREIEIAQRGLSVSHRQLQEELADANMQLQSEKEAKRLQESLYKEQIKLFQNLQDESKRAEEQKSTFISRLQVADTTKQGLEQKVSDLIRTKSQLEAQLATEKRNCEDSIGRLEMEIDNLKKRLLEKCDAQVMAEESMVESKKQFECHLTELRDKAEMLSSTLDNEADRRKRSEEEVSILQDRLEKANDELRGIVRSSNEQEKAINKQLEELRREAALKQKDLETTKEQLQLLTATKESLEDRLQQSDNELRASQALLLQRANQIAALQREGDHKEMRVASMEEQARSEKEQHSKLGTQLSVVNEKMSSLQTEIATLKQQLDAAQGKLIEKEKSACQAQEKFEGKLHSMRAKMEKSKSQYDKKLQSLMEQQVSTREELARKEAELSAVCREKEGAQAELKETRSAHKQQQETIKAVEEAYSEVQGERERLSKKVEQLEQKLLSSQEAVSILEKENVLLKEKVSGLQLSLTEASEVKCELGRVHGQLSATQAQVEAGKEREQSLNKQITHLTEIRSTLEAQVNDQQREVHQLEGDLEKTRALQSKSEGEANESRQLWENEVKSKSKLSEKLMELERSQVDTKRLIEQEKRKVTVALGMKDKAEKETSSFKDEIATLKSQLKSSKRRVQQLRLSESQIPGIKAEFDREQASFQQELTSLKRLLEAAQEQLSKEVQIRRKTENEIFLAKREIDSLQTRLSEGETDALMRQRELTKTTKLNKKLRDELRSLNQHVADNMVSRVDFDYYKKLIDEKARQQVSQKLEEVNAHLEQQSQAQEALARLRNSTESDWKHKYERTSEEMKARLGLAMSEKDNLVAEARRFKDLYESELCRSEKLNCSLQKAKNEAHEAKQKLSLERNRTQQLFHVTQSAAADLSPPRLRHSILTASTLADGTHSPTDQLLSSVRAELDGSIARHMDTTSVPAPRSPMFGMATRSTLKHSSPLLPSKHSHLESIKRNYRI